jgi:hypothetical protein
MYNTRNFNLGLNNKVTVNGKPKLILISAAALLGFMVLIIAYYIISSKKNNSASNVRQMNNVSVAVPVTNGEEAIMSSDKGDTGMPMDNKEVFNIRRNIYAMEDAEAACKVFDSEVATIDQLIDAHKAGADWCNVGWTKDGIAAFPVQKDTWMKTQDNEPSRRNECGEKYGVNIVRSDPQLLYGVNCYGTKPDPRGIEKVRTKYMSDKEKAMLKKYQELKKTEKEMLIAPFNEDRWSR